MPVTVGDLVHIRGVGTGIVRALRRGHATVEIKGRTLVVDVALLGRAEPAKVRSGHKDSEPEGDAGPEGPAYGGFHASIDLHGHTVEEALAALDAFVNDALLASASEVRIIHGRSGGRLKDAVHRRLRELPPVRAFRVDPRNPGVTIVRL
jgi:DNA mismatch repair protein MutS2